MYEQFYGLSEYPFSITPNPRFVYLSQRHRDALAHLLYGVGQGSSGGFIQLTGEVGTGKTTLCRLVLEQVPDTTRIALILNPMLSPRELMHAICHELGIRVDNSDGSLQQLQERLNQYLLECHAEGMRVVLIIDEAQNMSRDSLEQVRLLTNLETSTDKLLQIILIGQPELRELLSRQELRQLAQRITARYHLDPLNEAETEAYVRHRLEVADAQRCPFTADGLRAIYQASDGVPRLINIIADRALIAGYSREADRIGAGLVRAAAREVAGEEPERPGGWLRGLIAALAMILILTGGATLAWTLIQAPSSQEESIAPAWTPVLEGSTALSAFLELSTFWPGLPGEQVQSACLGQESELAACLALRGNWGYLQQINLPLVLQLHEPPGGHILLAGLASDDAIVRQNGQDWRVPRTQIERRWRGELLVAWPDDGTVMRIGDSGPQVLQIKELASDVMPQPWTGEVNEVYDEAFRVWVTEFQRRHGIGDDGLIGPATRLFLGQPQLDAPTLLTHADGV